LGSPIVWGHPGTVRLRIPRAGVSNKEGYVPEFK
jgi:hypothetical protein